MDPVIDNFLNGFTLVGIPAVVLIPLILNGLKTGFGLPSHWTLPIGAVLAALVFIAIGAVQQWPQIEPAVKLIVGAVLMALSASGAFSQFKLFTKGNPAYPGEPLHSVEKKK